MNKTDRINHRGVHQGEVCEYLTVKTPLRAGEMHEVHTSKFELMAERHTLL